MQEHIEKINHGAKTLYDLTKDAKALTRNASKLVQSIIDELQEARDKIENERLPWED